MSLSKRNLIIGTITICSAVILTASFQNCAPSGMETLDSESNSLSSSSSCLFGLGSGCVSNNESSQINSSDNNQIVAEVGEQAVPASLNIDSQIFVATMYSHYDHITKQSICYTASNPEAAKFGYFDQGSYSYCNSLNEPMCQQGSKKVILSQTEILSATGEQQLTKYHTACVMDDAQLGFNIVASIYSSSDSATNKNTCKTAKDLAANSGYFDLGNYSLCDTNSTPLCVNGSYKLVMGSSSVPGTSETKYHTVCAMNSAKKTRIVATIYSEYDRALNKDICIHSSHPTAQAAGYWDLGNFSACENGIPKCLAGSYKVVNAMTAVDQNKIKYHTWCILPDQSQGSKLLATIYSSSDGSKNTCLPANDPAAAAKGYWDVNSYAYCDASGTPKCGKGSKQVLISDSLNGKTVAHHQGCIQP